VNNRFLNPSVPFLQKRERLLPAEGWSFLAPVPVEGREHGLRIDDINTLYRIDLVDIQATTERFRANALSTFEVIYE
jgi:hypothetical protein